LLTPLPKACSRSGLRPASTSILVDEPIDRIAAGAVPIVRPAPPQALPGPQKSSAARQDVSTHVEDARQAAQACQTLEDLLAAISAFDGCPLKFQGAKQAVFSRGSPEAPILVVGEGPGQEEDQRGQPFVGRAGQLMDRMFAAAGIADRVFITNSVFWRPPGNRNPTPEEQAVCMPFVERAIALVQPRLLLCVGGQSSKAMLKREEGILSFAAAGLSGAAPMARSSSLPWPPFTRPFSCDSPPPRKWPGWTF